MASESVGLQPLATLLIQDKPEPNSQERQLPPDEQSLVDAYNYYLAFNQVIQEFQKAEQIDTEQLSPPWREIGEEMNRDKATAKLVFSYVQNGTLPEAVGRACFEAKDKYDQTPPIGPVKAEYRNGFVVLVVADETDLVNASNLKKFSRQPESSGGTFARSGFTVMKDGQPFFIPQVATIIVLDRQDDAQTEQIIQHEMNHRNLEMFLSATSHSGLVDQYLALLRASKSVDSFDKSDASEADLLLHLRNYSQQMKLEAVAEATCEMMSTGKMDYRDAYADDYFMKLFPVGQETKAAPFIEQVQAEFAQEMRLLKQRLDRSINTFSRIEEDRDLVIGTVTMRLLMANATTLDQALDSLGFIDKLRDGEEAVGLQEDIFATQNDLFRRDNLRQYDAEIKGLLHQNAIAANTAKATDYYGYKQARQGGSDLPQALAVATTARLGYLEASQPIRVRLEEIKNQAAEPDQANEAKSVVPPIESPSPISKKTRWWQHKR